MKTDREHPYSHLDTDINAFNYTCIECGIMFWVAIACVVECLVPAFHFLYILVDAEHIKFLACEFLV